MSYTIFLSFPPICQFYFYKKKKNLMKTKNLFSKWFQFNGQISLKPLVFVNILFIFFTKTKFM